MKQKKNNQLYKFIALEVMPAKECIMLLDGKHYLTGSDYSDEYLFKSLGSLVKERKQKRSLI